MIKMLANIFTQFVSVKHTYCIVLLCTELYVFKAISFSVIGFITKKRFEAEEKERFKICVIIKFLNIKYGNNL
jgi:fructose-specific phosphotransferase system IIC component